MKARGRIWAIPLLVLASAWALPANAAGIDLSVTEPRSYGHVAGDRIERRLRLRLPPGYRLERTSLPATGKVNYWLELADMAVDGGDRGGTARVTLGYQLFYAPLQVVPRRLPAFRISASNDAGERLEARVPSFDFTMSPLIALRPEAEFGDPENGIMAADEQPDRLPVAEPRRGALTAFGVFSLALLLWAWAADRLPGRRRGPFGRAVRSLRRLRESDRGATEAAMRTLHRAFDETAGHAVFAEDVDAFVTTHPAFSDLHDDIAAFFESSRHLFFAADDGPRGYELDEVRDLTSRCRARELRT
ncbi:nonribosomal peptide synthetase MxaA [Thiohalorhabdus methylotrophus]|uniref:Nonribosomal peptide synthetase MxaA n=1 Tax=Thiohalorhabdus methylotrophus TaxID=3242694 RepID=A0ABV4TYN2_9GAMM